MTTKIFARAKNPLAAISAALALTLGASQVQAQGVPTIDLANLTQALVRVQQLAQQVQQMRAQYETMTQQFKAITGNRNLGAILNDPRLVSYLPGEWQGVYSAVKSGQLKSITSAVQAIQKAEGMTAKTPGQQRVNDTLASNNAMAQQAFQATVARLQNIQDLMQQSNFTQDAAAKADLQNRLNAEVAMVNNEQTRMQLMSQLGAIEMKLAERQQANEFHRNVFLQGAGQ